MDPRGAGCRRRSSAPPTLKSACNTVSSALSADKVPIATSLLGTGSGQDSLGVVVGKWSELTPQLVARLVEHGPDASGIYAKFIDGGAALALLDARGNVVRTLHAGAGLVAATSDSQSKPTWLITGTDAAGVNAAARALTAADLKRHFAVAVSRRIGDLAPGRGHELTDPQVRAGRRLRSPNARWRARTTASLCLARWRVENRASSSRAATAPRARGRPQCPTAAGSLPVASVRLVGVASRGRDPPA